MRRTVVDDFDLTRAVRAQCVPKSASSPSVCFGGLNDNTIKGLINLLSVEQEIEYIEYT